MIHLAKQVSLPFPFWIKPVKSVLSHLGFRVENAAELRRAIEEIRAGLEERIRTLLGG